MLSPSVLPITPQGRIYHLNLSPHELADTIITVGDPARVAMLSRYFDLTECQRINREFVTHTGIYQGKRLSVVSTGIGASNIDIVLNEIDALKNVDFQTREIKDKKTAVTIIRFGTTGGLSDMIKIGDMIITERAFGLDGLLHFYDYQPSSADKELISDFNTKVGALPLPLYIGNSSLHLVNYFASMGHVGLTVTSPGFYGPQDREIRIPITVNSLATSLTNLNCANKPVLNFEMESAPLLAMGSLLGHHCASISVVIAERNKGRFSGDAEGILAQSIESFLSRLATIPI